MTQKKYFVIGSNSFAGGALIDHLLSDPNLLVVGLSRSSEKSELFLPYRKRNSDRFRFFQRNLATQSEEILGLMDEIKPEVVVNFAALNEVAISHDYPAEYYETNCVALARLLNPLKKRTYSYLKKYIHISTPEVYGSCPVPLAEDAPFNPSTPYAASKASADLYLQTLWKNFQFPVIWVRTPNYYGAYQQLHKIIPRSVIYIRKGETISLHGGGIALKTWIHIRDVARGIQKVIDQGWAGEVYHFSDNRNVLTVRDVVERICLEMNVEFAKVTRLTDERLGQDARYLLNDDKARRKLDWSPEEDFDKGLSEVIQWVDDYWPQILKEPLNYQHKD